MTAVEWLEKEIKKLNISVDGATQVSAISIFQQALEMEKQQIIEAATWGALQETGEKYYSETYKKDNQ